MKNKVFKALRGLLVAFALIVMCAVLLPTQAQAAEVASGTCGENLTWVLDDSGTLTISGTGKMANYEYENTVAPWFTMRRKITSVIIEDGVTSIGNAAFCNCISLTSVTIPDGVTSIGDLAFYSCSSLTSVTIPDGVTSIGDYAFIACSSLTSVTIPDGVTSIGDYAFCNCSSLTSVTIGDGVTSIGSEAFNGCRSLTSVTIGDGVTSIGDFAFCNCISLTSVYITDLEAWCQIQFDFNAANPLSYGAALYLNGELVTDLVIPDTIASIGNNAFCGCISLTSVTIPDGVTSIGNAAFCNCSSLTSVTIGDGVTSIKDYAFFVCRSLTSVTIPDGVTSIGEYAFYLCDNLWHVLYKGTEEEWNAVTIDSYNELLISATRHYRCTGNEITDLANKKCSICLTNCTHAWGEGVVAKQPSCAEEGVKTYTCTVCKETKTEAIAKLTTHTPGAEATATTPQICTVCGKELKPATGATEPPATEPPATEPPATEHPATEPPATEPPATEPPATEPPATEPTVTPTQPEGNKNPDDGEFPIIVVIAIVVLGGGGATAGVILWKKKH